jgi:hypothetical protein
MSLIRTEYIAPPVPTTMFDWMAYIDGEEDGTGNALTGRGPTETEALRDLAEQLAAAYLEAA